MNPFARRQTPFRPDPDFDLPEDVRTSFPAWVREPALRRLLSALPQDQWSVLASALTGSSGGPNRNVPGVLPTGDPAWDWAYWDLYEDVRRSLDLAESYPFTTPDG